MAWMEAGAVRALYGRGGAAAVALQLLTHHPAEVAAALACLESDARSRVLAALPCSLAAQALLRVPAAQAREWLGALPAGVCCSLAATLPEREAAALLRLVPCESAPGGGQGSRCPAPLPAGAARTESSMVGSLLLPEVVRVSNSATVAGVLRALRRGERVPGTLSQVYVVDAAGRLVRFAPLGALLAAPPSARVAEIARHERPAVRPETPLAEALRRMREYGFHALPVVDAQGVLLGAVAREALLQRLRRPERAGGPWPARRRGGAVRRLLDWLRRAGKRRPGGSPRREQGGTSPGQGDQRAGARGGERVPRGTRPHICRVEGPFAPPGR
jgi:magnesium transporter